MPSSTPSIRPASPSDFAAMWPIFRAVVATGDTYVFAPDTPREDAFAYWFGPGVRAWVAEVDGAVAGMYKLVANQRDLGVHVANASFMVDPARGGLGIGRAMGRHCLREAKRAGFEAMQFNFVVSTNAPAVALWKSIGFAIVGTIPKAFRHARLGLVDAYVMHRFLADVDDRGDDRASGEEPAPDAVRASREVRAPGDAGARRVPAAPAAPAAAGHESTAQLTVHHIPVCPFSQRLEILLALKGRREAVDFRVVDVTRPREPALLRKTGGATSLPVLETADGRVASESLVILRYLEDVFPQPTVAHADPWRHAVESMLIAMEREFTAVGYTLVMNQDRSRRDALLGELLARYRAIDDFLCRHAPRGPWLHGDFGLAEVVYTPMFMRFWFLDYYEGFDLPDEPGYARVREWRDACVAHPAVQQVTREQIVKLYYDYARGAGNGALLPGRTRSSFAFEPHWSRRPWPPRDKYGVGATDAELGLA